MLKEREFNSFANIRWLDSMMIGHKGFIAGGCFKNIFKGEKVKDVDIFFENAKDWEDAVQYFNKLCGENNCGGEYCFYYENSKVKAFKKVSTGLVIELVCNVFGTPKEILNMFDFTITKFAYAKKLVETIEESKDLASKDQVVKNIRYYVVLEELFFEHLHLNRLVVDNKLPYPISTFERMIRYAKYGYFPCKDTKMKIINGIRAVDTVDGLSESLYDGID